MVEKIVYDNTTPKTCPKCGEVYIDYPALSRVDNETYICPNCGAKEAIETFILGENR